MQVKIKKLNENAVIPKYAKPGDMGMDITAISVEFNTEYQCFVYHTGLAFKIPDGYGMLIFPRSSNRMTDAYLTNSVGVLDSGYTGELQVCFKNRDAENKSKPYSVGERIAQIVIIPYPIIEFIEVDDLPKTERGTGGFGSTNNK